nr:hypothetical protein CcurKRNrm1_p035 [Cryptomonas curvata]
MYFFSFLSKNFLHESIHFNSFEISYFFCIFLYFPFCVNILVIKLKNKKNKLIKNISNLKKNFYYLSKNYISFKANINPLKNFISSVSTLKRNHTTNFCIRVNNNYVYVISVIKQQFLTSINTYSILFGKRLFGQGKTMLLSNYIIYSKGYNSILLGIFVIFPYLFFKNVKIFKGINFITDIKINFILIILKTKFGNLRIFTINFLKFYKNVFISQIGNFSLKSDSFNLLDIIVWKNEILIANSENNSIRTWKIKFDLNKKIKIFQQCGWLDSLSSNLSFLYWGKTFRNYLFTGEINYRTVIWNELLIPLLKINNIGFFLLDSKFSFHISGFILIFKKIYNKIKTTTTYDKSLVQTSIKFYSNWNKSKLTLRFILDRIYYLGIIKKLNKQLKIKDFVYNFENINKNSVFYQLLLKLVINILEKVKKKIISLSSLSFLYSLLYRKFWNLFTFDPNLALLIIKRELLSQIWKIGQLRKISLYEIETEQVFSTNKKEVFFYKTCNICKRISTLKFNFKKKINICEFFHSFGKKFHIFPIQNKFNFLANYKIKMNQEVFLPIDKTPKIFVFRNIKYFIRQKEFIWFWRNEIACIFSITLKNC